MATKANMSWVTDDLATGGDLSMVTEVAVDQALDIISQGVTHVIDLRAEASDAELWGEVEEIAYGWLPSDDAVGYQMPAMVFEAAAVMDRDALANGGKTLVHCHMGVNRGPSAAVYLLLDRGYSAVEAYDMVAEARPQAGIAYALDALHAFQHGDRGQARGFTPTQQEAEMSALRDRIQQVMTRDRNRLVSHTIRQGHANDAEEIRRRLRNR